ncbi:BRCT domain-containing protein 2 [Elsinoe australis]|uniref:BRCT domain-containing protein 2 n=1 Tax=Elsinoe australis TaxID=40998 RepID=A0A4U7BCI3_9PEZI|nr:BRCT domain-containing protein 2 [Elsinoe australis]
MPTTRAMARKVSTASDDKENEAVLSLRKKPVRRATAKGNAARGGRKAVQDEQPAMPLSPKKTTQISQARGRQARSQAASEKTNLITEPNESIKPRRNATKATRAAARTQPDTSNSGRGTRAASAAHFSAVSTEMQPKSNGSHAEPAEASEALQASNDSAAQRPSAHKHIPVHRQSLCNRTANVPSTPAQVGSPAQGTSLRSLQGTPMENKTLQMPRRVSFALDQQFQSQPLADQSDDELCGPKTPLHRRVQKSISPQNHIEPNTDLDHSDQRSSATPALQTLKTPLKKMLVYQSKDGHPQTTKVPLKPADSSSPRRPVSVSRGSSMAYVFHPLPKASRVHSPLKGPYQWPVTPSDEEGDPIDDDDDHVSISSSRRSTRSVSDSRSNTPGLRRSIHKPAVRERFTQLFNSESDDEDGSSEDEEDEPAVNYFPHLRRSDAHESKARAAFVPDEADASSEESEEDDNVDDISIDQSLNGIGEHTVRDDNDHGDESQDLSDITPRLPSGIFESTPTKAAPAISNLGLDSSPASDDELLGTPTLSGLSHFSSNSVDETPRSRSLIGAASEHSPQAQLHTPVSRPRLSTFRTPHMRSALEEFNQDTSLVTPGASVLQDTVNPERIACIDPSLLSQQTETLSPRKDSVQLESLDDGIPAKPLPILDSRTVPGQMAPLVDAPAMPKLDREQTARLSLLLNTDGLIEPQEDENSWLDDVDTTVVIKDLRLPEKQASTGAEQTEDAAEPSSNEDSIIDGSVIQHETTNSVGFPGNLFYPAPTDDESLPHYALPTVASDIRRKSMPLLPSQTPKSNASRPHTAETTVKPHANPVHFAQLWLDRQEQPSAPASRRQSMLPITPSASKAQLLPSSLPRATSSLALRKRSSMQSVRNSYIAPETPSAITPRPRCYTPTQALTTLKQASARPTPVTAPRSPPKKPSSPRKTASPRKAQSPHKPLRTPLKSTPAPSAAFTPHPSAPLRGVVAYVEVFTRASLPASASFIASLQRLGAKVVKSFSESVTHVVWKDGSSGTLAKVRGARKDGREVWCVNSRWVVECDAQGRRVDEEGGDFEVDVGEFSGAAVGSGRRRKSLEPKKLVELGGWVLTPGREKGREDRGGRLSVANENWAESPMKGGPVGGEEDRMPFSDEEDESWFDDERTPVRERVAEVPGSVPAARVRRFDVGYEGRRRLTAWGE